MKNFNLKLFWLLFGILGLIFIPSIIAAGAEDEGMVLKGIWKIFLGFFSILRFPTHTLFWFIFSLNNFFYFIGFLFNFSLYSLIMERTLYYIKYYKSN